MATQGILSVVQNGEVALKIIAGDNGMVMPTLREKIETEISQIQKIPSLDIAYHLALGLGMSTKSLVVMNKAGVKHQTGERLHRRYRRTFNKPEFNPRWKQGIADYIEVITL